MLRRVLMMVPSSPRRLSWSCLFLWCSTRKTRKTTTIRTPITTPAMVPLLLPSSSSAGALDVIGGVDSLTSSNARAVVPVATAFARVEPSLASVVAVVAVVEGGDFLVNDTGAAVTVVSAVTAGPGRIREVAEIVELVDSVGPILELLPVGQHWTGAGLEQNPGLTGAPRHVCSAVSMQRPSWPYLHHQSEHGINVWYTSQSRQHTSILRMI